MRKISAILLTLAMVSTVFASVPMVYAKEPVQNSVLDQAWTGDQIITPGEIYTNEIIWVTGNITIPTGASLTLVNTTIVMNSSATIRYHIEVQNGGALALIDGGDGLAPMDVGDSDPSIITANVTANYNFWIDAGATVSVQNSQIQYAGNNTNMPPDPWSGIFIQSNSVSIQNSLISDCEHALIYDSCFPALLAFNNISNNNGLGVGIGALTNPLYKITGTISNNNIVNNGGTGLEMHAPDIDVEIFNMNVSENNYGINIYGDATSYANIHNNILWRNFGPSDNGASAIYVYANETGIVDATVTHNTVIENQCGVRLGFRYGGIQSGTTTALIANNTLIGNDGGTLVNAEGNANVKMVDNYQAGSDYFSKVDKVKFGMEPSNDYACQNLTLEYARNVVWCGMAGDGWNTAVVLQTGAQKEMVATVSDNDIRGGANMGGVFWLGSSRNSWNYMPENLTAYVADNYIQLLYDFDSWSSSDISYAFTFDSQFNTDLTFIDNTYYSTDAAEGGPDYGNSVLYMGADDSEGDMTYNLTALIQGNRFITRNQYDDNMRCAYIWGNAKLDLDVKIIDNYFEYIEYYSPSYYMTGFIIFGDPRDADYGPVNVHLDIMNNEMFIVIPDGHGIAPWGLTRFSPNASCENTFLNYTGNDVTYVGSDSQSYLTGTLIIGNADDDEFSKNVTANINDNNIFADFGSGADTAGGAIVLNAWENLIVNMNNNRIESIQTDETTSTPYGVRLGFYCNSNGIITKNTTVKMNNNDIITAGRGSALLVGALNDLDFEFDGGEISKAFYGDCGGWGPYGTEYSYGSGIAMLAPYMNATIKNAYIHDNHGAGIYADIEYDANIDIMDCTIEDNLWHGILLQSQNGVIDATGSIEGCTITGNGANLNGDLPGLGSGMYFDNVIADVVNCTLDNSGGNVELGIMSESHVTALNTIFDKNSVFLDSAAGFLTGGTQPENTWATWAAVGNNGYFNITIDGVSADVGPVDLTGVVGGGQVATAVTNALVAAGFTGVTCTWTGTDFVITSGTTGNQSTVSALTTHSGALGTDISGVAASTGVTAWWLDCAINGTSTAGTTATLLVQWFMHVKAQQLSSGLGLPGASVTVRDVTGTVVGTGTTANDGWRCFVVDEYFQNVTQSNIDRTYFTAHSVSATKGTATGNAAPVIMDATKDVIVILDYTSFPPVANAGPDQTVNEDVNMTFDGSGSTDDFWITNWTWTCAAANCTLYGETVNYTFNTPGVYTVTLTVTDYEGYTDTDSVNITVVDVAAPVANAGPDQTINEDSVVTFDGTGSTDNVAIINYTWTFTDGSTVVSLYGVSPAYTFQMPGAYSVTLTVSDGTNTATDTVIITVRDITAPVVDAGAGKTVPQGTTVILDGSPSFDNVGIVSYVWTFNDGANEVILAGKFINYTFTQQGNRTVALKCTDAAGNSATGTTWVNVCDMTPPNVLVVAPGESLTGVPIDWALIIVFDEPMDTASVEAAFSISGANATVTGFTWDATNRYVTIDFSTLAYGTTYTFMVGANSSDVAGNHMVTAYTGSFKTISAQETPEIQEPETNFFTDNWWILVVIIVILGILLLVSLLRGGSKEPAPPAPETPPEPPVEPETPAEPPEEAPAEPEVETEEIQ
ncbi:MAG: PKD domain-containing protein [Candidatus Thermoplasmatota archaeon]|nr:PKD domain-containing protein [Euryarchaeota archaeon]MBU4033020.1 PKD domain-containing protein [Candidatus Thermoplasmatota archaeon]MBU4144391.1 PKD domain-containing protein [Candidatus Thermoplasmatota archaeon]MBU4591314.1 PKD domain-containing protein [Candidatus Thermoplasmatota archaeon]